MDISPAFRARGLLYSLFNKGIPFHRDEDISPFFIVGSGRCGSTLLRRILNAAEGIYIPPENWALSVVIFKFRRLRMVMNWNTLVDLTVAAHYQDTQGWFDTFPTSFVDDMRNCPKDEQSLKKLINQLYCYHAQTTNKTCRRWGDKTPLNVNYMKLILRVFPNAKFIHMLRDGVDVVHSWNKRELYRDSIIKPAQRWISAINAANKFQKKYPDKILEVRYEDLVQTPSKTVKRVCSYLNITFDQNMLTLNKNSTPNDLNEHDHYKNALTPITDKYIGKGRKNLSSEDKRILKQEINKKLIKLGYESL